MNEDELKLTQDLGEAREVADLICDRVGCARREPLPAQLRRILEALSAESPPTADPERVAWQLRRTAWHEAGHFVTAWKFGRSSSVFQIHILPHGETLGATEGEEDIESPDNVVDDAALHAVLVGLAAGYEADVLLAPNETDSARRAAGDDDDKIANLLKHSNEEEESIRAEAKQLVIENQEAIALLAGRLIEARTIDRFEAEAILLAQPLLNEPLTDDAEPHVNLAYMLLFKWLANGRG